ncbi:MAG: hypothetical protein IJB96_00630 [Lachnospira sp.]|nr:hypothetical protein [Lachnospira sp.]
MEFDITGKLPAELELMVGAGGMLMLTAVLIMIILFKKRWHGRIIPMLLGLAAYFVFVFTPTNLILSAFSLIPSVAEGFIYNPQAGTIVYCVLLAATGVVAKIVVNKMLSQRYEKQGDVYMAGLGIGLGDAILYGMTAISIYIWCIAINSDGIESVLAGLEGMSEQELASTYESLNSMYVAPAILWLLYGVNAVIDIVTQFILTNITYGISKGYVPTMWYGISMAISFAVTITFLLFDEASLVSILIWFAVKLLIFVIAAYYAHFVVAKNIQYEEE